MSVVTLLTDFGLSDWFVGTVKGVILQRSPRTQIVDLTHVIPPGDIAAGAFALAAAVPFFPRGTIHLAIVDPGVGTGRRAVAIRTPQGWFVGPDNGLFSIALRDQRILQVRELTGSRVALQPTSHTFHGRDLFAPAAAHLAARRSPAGLGPIGVPRVNRIDWPEPTREPGRARGVVVYIDRFGNGITNLPNDWFSHSGRESHWAMVGRRRIPLGESYQSVPPGEPVAVPGSAGWLELAVNRGSAARDLRLARGRPVIVRV